MTMIGCEEKHKTPMLEERKCPVCGEEVEVFTKKGKLVGENACACGYVYKEE